MSRRLIDQAIDDAGLGIPRAFPRDLISDAALRLPLTTVLLPKLSAIAVRKWLAVRGIDHPVAERDRLLHGCLVAQAGVGAIFIDAHDGEHERRFSFAHEVAHFILDHVRPRLHALRTYGERILPVLNGERAATKEESLSSVLDRVPIGVHVHLMSRGPMGAVCERDIEEAEQNADRLAFELLAPANLAVAEIRPAFELADGMARSENAAALLVRRFGLPHAAARAYADVLIGQRRQTAFSTLELLGLKG